MKRERLQRQIPPMPCDDGCGECCGVTPCTTLEFNEIAAYAKSKGIEPLKQGITCPWFIDGMCAVYEVRPVVCQLFGHVDEMRCTRGYSVPVSLSVERSIVTDYTYELAYHGSRVTHDAVYSNEEIIDVINAEIVHDATAEDAPPEAMKAYHGARAMKMMRRGFESSIMVDRSTGEIT